MLPQHDKFCASLGNAADHNGLGMCLRCLHKESVEYGRVKLLDNIHLEDQGRDGRMTVGQVLQKLWRWEVDGIGLCSCSIAYLVISIELMCYAPILLCTRMHASHVTVRLYSVSLPHWLNLYASFNRIVYGFRPDAPRYMPLTVYSCGNNGMCICIQWNTNENLTYSFQTGSILIQVLTSSMSCTAQSI